RSTDSSTTATVRDLRWVYGQRLRQIGVEDGRDALPQAGADPEGIACVDGLPWPVGGRDLAPRPAAVHHGEHALQLAAQIAAGTPSAGRARRQLGRDLRPSRLAQLGGAGHYADGNRSGRLRAGL